MNVKMANGENHKSSVYSKRCKTYVNYKNTPSILLDNEYVFVRMNATLVVIV